MVEYLKLLDPIGNHTFEKTYKWWLYIIGGVASSTFIGLPYQIIYLEFRKEPNRISYLRPQTRHSTAVGLPHSISAGQLNIRIFHSSEHEKQDNEIQ